MTFFETLPFNSKYDRSTFECGVPSLNHYIREQVSQDIKRKLSTAFILLQSNRIVGYYTLSNDSILRESLEPSVQNKLPPGYKNLPTTLIGRLAVDISVQGTSLGKLLLFDAMKKAFETSETALGSMAIVVDPINLAAQQFYKKYGFISLKDTNKMFIPMNSIRSLFT